VFDQFSRLKDGFRAGVKEELADAQVEFVVAMDL
jgi:hypothetical protein